MIIIPPNWTDNDSTVSMKGNCYETDYEKRKVVGIRG
jgi:hypothetical protein